MAGADKWLGRRKGRGVYMLKVALVLARGVFGLFVSSLMGFGLYVMSLPLALSIWGYGNSVVYLLLFTTGIGAGVGGYLAWFDRDFKLGAQAALLAVAVICALAGAYFGMQRGIDVGAVHPIWRPGIPETSVTAMGAVISANAPLLALSLYRAIKNPRL